MSSSEDAKEYLSDNYDGEPSDWKRISKRKHNKCEVRVFENKKTNQQVELINFKNDDDFFTIDRVPTKFWIYLPTTVYDQLQDGTITEDYTSKCEEDEDDEDEGYFSLTGYKEPIMVTFQEAEAKDETDEWWHDQHVSGFVEEYHGVTDFFSMFDEQSENQSILIKPISLKDIKEMFTSKGLKFLGYKVDHND